MVATQNEKNLANVPVDSKMKNQLDPLTLQALTLKVTVITATYNAEKHLNKCMLSIFNQSYRDIEYIIIDGGSTDNTVKLIESHQQKLAYWISEPDDGIYDAWNKGIKKANGDWIVFVGADDELTPDAIQLYVNHILEHPNRKNLEFVSSRIDLVDEDLRYIKTVGNSWNWKEFKKKMITWHVGTFHAKQLFIKYGLFDTSYKISGDYELLLRARKHLCSSYFAQTTVKMRMGGVSGKNLIKASKETYRAKIKNGALSPVIGSVLKLIDTIRLTTRRQIK